VLFGNNSYLTELDPTQHNPTHGSTQPMAMSALIITLTEMLVRTNKTAAYCCRYVPSKECHSVAANERRCRPTFN